MKKEQRQVEVLISSLSEVSRIERAIEDLPRGYISVKQIAGHTYYYRQWREKDKIISNYVPEAFLKGVKQKIIIRKENEQLLKITKKDLAKAARTCIKAGLLTQEQVNKLTECAKNDNLNLSERSALCAKDFPNPSKEEKEAIKFYVEGLGSYNNILLATWGF